MSFCRGNRRDALFNDEGDFKTFLYILQQINKKAPFELISYCLMTNHFHLQIRSKEQPLSKVMSLINKQYADYYNTKNKVTGHVFEKRYYDRLAESKLAMLKVSRYIHLNPVDASMVTNAQSYQWSSYWYYMHTSTHGLLNTAIILDCFPGNEWEKRRRYREFCEEVPVTTRICRIPLDKILSSKGRSMGGGTQKWHPMLKDAIFMPRIRRYCFWPIAILLSCRPFPKMQVRILSRLRIVL